MLIPPEDILIFEAIPSLFMLLSLYLHEKSIFESTFGVTSGSAHLLKQKELFEFGSIQLFIGAMACYMIGEPTPSFFLIFFGIVWLVLPYFIMTFLLKNQFGWVGKFRLCVIYVGMVLVISVAPRHIQEAWSYAPIQSNIPIIIAIIIAIIVAVGEYINRSRQSS